MKNTIKRRLAMLLCAVLCLGALPVTALAASDPAEEVIHVSVAENTAAPTIVTQPISRSVDQGKTVTFKVKAKGSGLKYQWYCSSDGGKTFTKLSGKTKATLSFTVKREDKYQYFCRVSNKKGLVDSQTAVLDVNLITYRALLIGQTYAGVSGLTKVYGDTDVKWMKDLLNLAKAPKGEYYDCRSVTNASLSKIQNEITNYLWKADSNDVSLFYFSGLGDIASGGAYTGALTTMEGSGYDRLQIGTLADWLGRVPGKVIVLIDARGSGAAISTKGKVVSNGQELKQFNQAAVNAFAAAEKGKGAVANAGEFRDGKFIVLTSAKYQEDSGYTYTGNNASGKPNYMSHFTYWFCQGAVPFGNRKMDADANNNHSLTVAELYKYIKKHDSSDYSPQHVQVYPSASSTYVLFKS